MLGWDESGVRRQAAVLVQKALHNPRNKAALVGNDRALLAKLLAVLKDDPSLRVRVAVLQVADCLTDLTVLTGLTGST